MNDSFEVFSDIATHYRRFRPDYPDSIMRDLVEESLAFATESSSWFAADVGAGTGISTRQLAKFLGSAWTVVGVEPGSGMRHMARLDVLSNLRFVAGSAELLPFRAGNLHLVLAAQAVQWFERPRFYEEALRVLAPGGRLALLQNNRDWSSSSFLSAYESLLEENSPGYDRNYRSFDYESELRALGLSDVRLTTVSWTRPMTRETFTGMALSSSKMNAFVAKSGVLAATGLLNSLFDEAGFEDVFELPYVSELFVGHKEQTEAP